MATNHSLEMLEACRVTPFTNSLKPIVEFSLPFTYFDIMCLYYCPIEQIFFYQLAPNESTHTFFNSVLLPKLKHSLSLTLTHFLPMAGNIIWPVDAIKPIILYTSNDGVSLKVVESNSDFNHLSKNEMQEAIDLRPYVPKLPVYESKAAIIAFQITFFPSQGFSIGISCHHAMLDGKSASMFMKSWAYICKENLDITKKLPLHLTSFFDRTLLLLDNTEELDMLYLNYWSKLNSKPNTKSLKVLEGRSNFENLVRASFEFSREDINKLRQKVVSLLNEEDVKHIHLSSFVLSLAYTLVCIVKAKMVELRKGKICFGFHADCRSRLNPPIPTNYFGNCIIACPILMDIEAIIDSGGARKVGPLISPPLNGIAFVAKRLSEKIKELEKRVKNISIEKEKETLLELERAMKNSDVLLNIGVACSPKFESYNGTDFGWGKPKKSQIVHIDIDGSISITESKNDNNDINGGLVEVGLVIERHEMEIFTSLFVNGLK